MDVGIVGIDKIRTQDDVNIFWRDDFSDWTIDAMKGKVRIDKISYGQLPAYFVETTNPTGGLIWT